MPLYQDIPTAAEEIHVENSGHIPFAKQIFDTEKLYRNWATCCEISLRMAHIGFQHADNLQTQATISATLGILFGSRQMQDSAVETNRQAHETRKATVYFAALFLLASVAVTTLYWAVEEGLVGTIVKSISACGKSCINTFSGIFKRNKLAEQDKSLDEASVLEVEITTATPVDNTDTSEGMSQFKQDMFRRNAFFPSGLSVLDGLQECKIVDNDFNSSNTQVPSAPPAHMFNNEEGEQSPRSRSLSLTKA